MNDTTGHELIEQWFDRQGWEPFPYQRQTWQAFLAGKSGLLNAPTGSGKTYALWMPVLIKWINDHPQTYRELADSRGKTKRKWKTVDEVTLLLF